MYTSISGPWPIGMDETQLYIGRKVRQHCNSLQCEVREQGMYASCTSIMYESVLD